MNWLPPSGWRPSLNAPSMPAPLEQALRLAWDADSTHRPDAAWLEDIVVKLRQSYAQRRRKAAGAGRSSQSQAALPPTY
jgi:hypothetical protein